MILAADNIVTYGAEAATLHMTMYSAALIRILRMQGYQAALPNAEDFRGALTSEEDKDAFRQIISQQLLKSLQSQIDNLQGATKQT